MTLILHLPWPPSTNHANRYGKNKRTGKMQYFPSKDKEAFFREADGLYMTQKRGLERVAGPFTYHLVLNRNMRHGGADGDNRGKYCLDYLQRVGLIDNDKLAEGGSWSWGSCEHGAMLSVHRAYPENEPTESANGRPDRTQQRGSDTILEGSA
jgi:Holliday junction resolvase RusA-like endonuclease